MVPIPSRRLLALLAAASLLFVWAPTAALILDLALIMAALLDVRRAARLEVERTLPAQLSLGERGTARLTLLAPSARPTRARVTDDLPAGVARLDEDGWERDVDGGAEIVYRFRPSSRGVHVFGDVHLRVLGPLGLAWRQDRVPLREQVRVLPGLAELRRLRALGIRERLRRAGLRNVRQRGEGRAFESLREYVPGDDPRTMDWKASAHRGGLMVRQYEAERSQNVVLALDAGRTMLERLGPMERLDHAMSAALQLADVASLQGDRVGIFAFADEVLAYLPPQRAPVSELGEAMSRIRARMVEPNYPLAFSVLRRRLGRRTLVIVFTDLIDTAASHALLGQLARSARRHLVLTVALRNPELDRWARHPLESDVGAYRRAAAEEMLEARAVALARMRRAGVETLDVEPSRAVGDAVERYLEIKYRGRL
ncbi:MAG TPA: DUF58 domain-containing protein [Gemmatimonadota bacterium]|nr:DUF58 domain-containing protein [Gemmatimonadota bacterium]